MKVLVTGFDPFMGSSDNPSQLVVEALGQRLDIPDVELVTMVLPTQYAAASDQIVNKINEFQPDICVMLGAACTPYIRLETTARNNTASEHADNVGIVYKGAIVDGGPETYANTLPLPQISDALEQAQIPVELSADAGGYVCNHIFYTACHAMGERGFCGFIHVPPPSDEGMTIEKITDAIAISLCETVNHVRRTHSIPVGCCGLIQQTGSVRSVRQ